MIDTVCFRICLNWFIHLIQTIKWGSLGTIVALCTLTYQIRKDRMLEIKKQASGIAAWIVDDCLEGDRALVFVSNMTNLPIYEVVLSRDIVGENRAIIGEGHDACTYIQTMPPGIYKVEVTNGGSGMSKIFEASISFRDVNGRYWCRNAAGHLYRIKNSIDQRKLDRPIVSTQIQKVVDSDWL